MSDIFKTIGETINSLADSWVKIKTSTDRSEIEPPIGSQEKFGGRSTPNVTVSGLPTQVMGVGTGTLLIFLLGYLLFLRRKR